MKRIISLILSVVIMACYFTTASALESFDELVSLGIVENNSALEDKITKAEFSFSVAKLMGSGVIAPTDTRYSDVTSEYVYSGYIEFLASRGVIDNVSGIAFGFDSYVSCDMANKMLVNALEYGKLAEYSGGYPVGFNSVAFSIGILDKITFADVNNITKKEAMQMLTNALHSELAASANNVNDFWDSSLKSGMTVLSQRFGLSVYRGEIEKANIADKTVKFRVSSNKYDSNPTIAAAGELLFLTAAGTLDIAGFEHVPAEIWVDEDGKAVFIKKQKNVEMKYAVIDSVNGRRDESEPFAASSVNELSFIDDETIYDACDELVMYYNGKIETAPVLLVDKLCKVVLLNDEVISIESWDYVEGGIITSVTDDAVQYKGINGKTLTLNDLTAYKNVRIVIEGRGAKIKELKANSVFNWWSNDEDIVIVVNERTVVDEFISRGSGKITIGNGIYYVDDVYYSKDGKKFSLNNDYNGLFGQVVRAYFSPNGKIRYVEAYTESDTSLEFYALVTGVERDNMDPEEATIEIWELSENPEKRYVNVTSKTVYSGTSLADLENIKMNTATSADDVASNVFILTKNAKGIITKIETAERMLGFSGTYATPSAFTNTVAYITAGGKSLYFDQVPVTVVYELDGQIIADQVSFEKTLSGKHSGSNSKMAFFADYDASEPALVLLWGDDVDSIGNNVLQYGIYIDKTETIDANGNEMYEITVVQGSGKNKYVVTAETASKLEKRSFITFYKNLLFSDDDIYLTATSYSFEGEPNDWEISKTSSGLKVGTVVRVDDKMLVTNKRDSDGTIVGVDVFLMHPTQNFFLEYDSQSANNQFKVISSAEIMSGDTVFYNNISDGVRGVIVVK